MFVDCHQSSSDSIKTPVKFIFTQLVLNFLDSNTGILFLFFWTFQAKES